jgi:hypothetical protein
MTNQERISAIKKFGFTEREASFLCLVALHGGYFLRRQYEFFIGQKTTGTGNRLIDKGINRGILRAMPTRGMMLVYRLCFRPFFDAIDESDNRNRRWRSPSAVRVKLMGLDYALAHRQHHYLATEPEKIDYFHGHLGIGLEWLPVRVYSSKNGRQTTSRYFVDKFPVCLLGAPGASSPGVNFCYVDAAIGKPCGFDTYLFQYRYLFERLENFNMTYVSSDELTFGKAAAIWARLVGNSKHAEPGIVDPDLRRLVEHFQARNLFERRETRGFDKQQLDQLRDELQEFKAPRFQALYASWKERGDAAVLEESPARHRIQGSFQTYLLSYEYPVFGEQDLRGVA